MTLLLIAFIAVLAYVSWQLNHIHAHLVHVDQVLEENDLKVSGDFEHYPEAIVSKDSGIRREEHEKFVRFTNKDKDG